MKKLSTYLIAISIFSVSACSIYRVHTSTEKKEGIPFLIKKIELEQKTVYIRPFYDVKLKVVPLENGVEKNPIQYPSKRTETTNNSNLEELQGTILKNQTVDQQLLTNLTQTFLELPSIDEKDPLKYPVANTIEREIVVDTTIYYLNGRNNLFGKSVLNFELNSDNTLTKGEASMESDLTELLKTSLPVSDVLSTLFISEQDTMTTYALAPEIKYRVSLELLKGAYQYTFTKTVKNHSEAQNPIPYNLNDGQFERKEILPGKSKDTDSSKEKENAVKINGSIEFPEKKKSNSQQ